MSIFKKEEIVPEIRAGRLQIGAQNYFCADSGAISDDYLWRKLLAAEAEIGRSLRVFLEPTEVLAGDFTQTEIDDLEDAGTPYYEEAAYDYDYAQFRQEWGNLVLKQSPVIRVKAMSFNYPGIGSYFEVPLEWIRLDRKYGQMRLIPASLTTMGPLNSFILSALSGGRNLPMIIKMRYTAGLQNVPEKWPDLYELIKRKAMLSIIKDSFVPQSGSLSSDGNSQSFSADASKFEESITVQLNSIRDAIHGVRHTVVI